MDHHCLTGLHIYFGTFLILLDSAVTDYNLTCTIVLMSIIFHNLGLTQAERLAFMTYSYLSAMC